MYRHFIKRIIDLLIATITIVALSPLFIIVIILVKISSEGPVFFTQERVGLNGVHFNLLKFRSMTNIKRDPSKEQTFKDNPEITKVGYYLRRFKIDELPQLLNVFRGDMAIIGPRPALPETYEMYGSLASGRLRVRPGLSGLSQIRGNIFLSWEKRFEYDNEYIEKMGFFYDIGIIIKTISIVLLGEEKFIKE